MILSVLCGKWAWKEKILDGIFWRWVSVLAGVGLLGVAGWSVSKRVGVVGGGGGGEVGGIELREVRLLGVEEIGAALEAEVPEMVALIRSFEGSVTSGHPERLRPFFDGQGMISLAMDGVPSDEALAGLRAAYINGTLEAWSGVSPVENLGDGHYQFLRVRKIAGHAGLLFRLADGEDLNYHLHKLTRDASGRYRVADTYLVGLSESLSDVTRRGYLHLAADALAEGSTDDEAVQHSRQFVEHMEVIGSVNAAVSRSRYSEALDLYHSLPEGLQRDRDVLLMRIEASGKISPLLLDEALTEWRTIFPREEQLPLKFMDFHVARGEYEAAHALAERVEALTGGDSYLRARIGELRFAFADRAPAFREGVRRHNASRGGTAAREREGVAP
ncbi:hypothetical protein BH23VER1_BH23VER1_03640 [soil metagenome]